MKQDKATTSTPIWHKWYWEENSMIERKALMSNNTDIFEGYQDDEFIEKLYNKLHPSPSIPVNDELDIPKGKWYFYDTIKKTYSGYGVGQSVQLEIATEFSKKPLDTQSIGKMSFTALGGNNKEDYKKATDTMQAICTAVNETYGKGYNPAAMEELYTLLTDVATWGKFKNGVFEYKTRKENFRERLQTALHNAKTIKS